MKVPVKSCFTCRINMTSLVGFTRAQLAANSCSIPSGQHSFCANKGQVVLSRLLLIRIIDNKQ